MDLSKELVDAFVKVTNDSTENKNESTVYGTIVKLHDTTYVRIDGSDLLTPITSTVAVADGERVTVMIKNHNATVTGNVTSPAAKDSDVQGKANKEDLDVEKGRVDELSTRTLTVEEKVTANEGYISQLTVENETIKGRLDAQEADIKVINSEKISSKDADLKYATIEDANVIHESVRNLEGDYSAFKESSADHFTANDAEIRNLKSQKLNAVDADLKYANIDFSNIGKAAMEYFYAQSGLIKNVTIGDATIAGEIVGVTFRGDLIVGNTIVADKLVIKGEDGLYYKLNTDGVTAEKEQTDYNSLNGQIIRAKSVTAEKVAVDDLVAFGATIGGFHITLHSIFSGVKESATNTTRGIFLGDDGQFAFGDGSDYVKYYRDQNGTYKLAISASEITISAGKNLADAMSDLEKKMDDVKYVTGTEVRYQAGASGTTAPTGAWLVAVPVVPTGQFLWTRTTTKYNIGDDVVSYSVGATGGKGEKGDPGADGDSFSWNLMLDSANKKIDAVTYNHQVNYELQNDFAEKVRGQSVTISAYVEGTGMVSGSGAHFAVDFCLHFADGSSMWSGFNRGNVVIESADGSIARKRYTRTINIPDKEITAVSNTALIIRSYTSIGSFTIKDTKIEVGSTATEWSPNPADLIGEKGETGSAGRGITSTVVTYQAGASGTTIPTGSWVSSPPATSADKPYMWTKTVYTYTDGTTSESYTVGATPEGIEVGGRNLLLSTKTFTPDWKLDDPVNVENNGECTEINMYTTGSTSNYIKSAYSPFIPIEKVSGKTITFSFEMMLDKVDDWDLKYPLIFEYFNSDHTKRLAYKDIYYDDTNLKILSGLMKDGEWFKYGFTRGINGSDVTYSTGSSFDDVGYVRFRLTLFRNGSIRFRKPKLEFGNKATDWTPAPEDVDAAIDEVEKKIELVVASGSSSSSLTLTDSAIAAITKQFKVTGTDGSKTIIEGGKLKVDDLSAISGKFTGSVVASSFKYSEKFGNGTIFFAVEDMHLNFGYKDSNGTFVTGLGVDASETNISGSRITLDSTVNEGVGIFIEDQIWLNGNTTIPVLTVDYDMSVGGSLKFANNTWNFVGDDVYIGDHNKGGCLCIKSAYSNYNPGIVFYDSSDNEKGSIRSDSSGVLVTSDIKAPKILVGSGGVLYASGNDQAYWWGSTLNNLVIESWFGVSFTTNCGGQAYTGKTAIGINCRDGSIRAGGDISTAGGLELQGGWADWKIGSTNYGSIYCNGSNHAFSVRSNSGNQIDLCSDTAMIYCVNRTWSAWATVKGESFTKASSIRYKTNVIDMTEERAKRILRMRPVSYDYTNMGCERDQLGLIAEEVEAIDKYAVSYDEYNRPDSLDYSKFVPQLIKLCQLQQHEINELKETVSKLIA